jgi:ribonuclease BN (tRNA processing enzyme)
MNEGIGARLRFIGSGDAFGSGGRLQTCMYLSGQPDTILIDCGASSLIGLRRDNVDPHSIGTILVSHLHGDHFGGVPFLVLDGQFRRRELALTIAGPPGIRDRVESAMEILFPGSVATRRRFEIAYVELAPRRATPVGPAIVTAFVVDHACGAPPYALRVEYAHKTVTYSGDTAWTDELIEASKDADLFVCEAYFAEKKVPFHLDLATLHEHRRSLSCKRLLLTHMHDDMLEAPRADGERAHDGLEVIV